VSEDGLLKLEILKVKVIMRLNDEDTLHEYHRKKDKDCLPEFHLKIIGFHEFFKVIKMFEVDQPLPGGHYHPTFPCTERLHGGNVLQGPVFSSLTVYLDMLAIEADTFSAKSKMESMMAV
jgi:hypothetical protein